MSITAYALQQEPRLFIALLGRAPDGVQFANYAYAFEANQPLVDIAGWMYWDYQATQYPSSMSNAQIAAKFYTNIFGHAPTAAALAPWQAKLDAYETPASVMVQMIESLVNYTGSDPAMLQSQALFNNRCAVAVWYASNGGDEVGTALVLAGVTADPHSVIDAAHAAKGHWHIALDAPDPTLPAPGPGTPAPAPAPPQTIVGTDGSDTLSGGAGNDSIDGKGGSDTVIYPGPLKNYTVHSAAGALQVVDITGAQGHDTVTNVEHLQFADMTVSTGVAALARQIPAGTLRDIIELYVVFFNRIPDAPGMEYWIGRAAAGVSVQQMADAFYSAGVQYSALTGYSAAMTNGDFVNAVYHNALGRDSADAEGLAFWSNALATGAATRGTLVKAILDSAHTFKGSAQWGWVADLLDNKAAVGKLFAVDMGLGYNTPEDSISHGAAIAHAVTPTDTAAAVALIGVNPDAISLV